MTEKKVSPRSSGFGFAPPWTERNLGGYQGEGAKTVIPSKAYAKFSTRLVPNQNPQKIAKLVEKHIRKLLPKGVHCRFEVLSTGKPWVAAYKAPIFQVGPICFAKRFWQKSSVHIREGGSIPFVTPNARHLQSAMCSHRLRASR